jgi:small-conductance mechanosensitive channel
MDQVLFHRIINALILTACGLVLFYGIFFVLKRWSRSKTHKLPSLLNKHLHFPGLLLFIVITLTINLAEFKEYFSGQLYNNLYHIHYILLILAISFLLIRTITFFRDYSLHFYEKSDGKNYKLRTAKTKFQLIERVIKVVVIVGTIAAVLMTFHQVREVGTTLLASAGVAGIVLGFAAQKSLGTLFAGIQIAISQPVRLDDTVVVEGTFGVVSEITLTYVVLETWDEKKLIIPINYFLENSYENWTRSSPEVVGKVKIYTDYTLPVDIVRKEFLSWLNTTPLWDKRKSALLVTGADDKTIEVRATMSSKNSDDAFDLECMIREKLITYIREHFPETLPTARLRIKTQMEKDEKQ